jgi:cytochrome c peroxidase
MKMMRLLALGALALLASASWRRSLPETEVALGEALFFEKMLSTNGKISCASCHIPAFAFSDTTAFSRGWNGGLTTRNTPGLVSVSERAPLFWDGRSPNLEDQVMHPLTHPVEMGMTREKLHRVLNRDAFYVKAFLKVYGKNPDTELLARALAAYERSLDAYDAPFDRYMFGDSNAISPAAIRGRQVFLDKGRCFECHFSPHFTIDDFRNIGLFDGRKLNDSGRYNATRDPADIGRFRVPGLRNVALTAPYMHNGMFRTLEEVVEYYDNPSRFVPDAIGRDTLLARPLGLTSSEKADLVAFMKSLTASRYQNP